MKQLLEFIPLVVFFICYKAFDIYVASGALVIATLVQIIALKCIYNHVEKVQLVSFVLILIFGSLTYFFHDDAFIKWKVTIINGFFAVVLFVGQVMRKPILEMLLGQRMPVSQEIWSRITWLWIAFFAGCAVSNWYIAFHMSQDTWVNFKVFGLMGLSLAITGFTVFYLYKHLSEDNKKAFRR